MSDESTRLKVDPGAPTAGRVVVFWDGGSTSHELSPGSELIVGRGEDCDLRIPDDSVSRRHALLRGGPPPTVEDLGSANGTVVASASLLANAPAVLGPSTVVELGDAILVVRSGAAPISTRQDGDAPALDPAMAKVWELVGLVAATSLPVLLLGETGVGKGVVAEAIHRESPRSLAPFVRINCAALTDTLLESELFGHERGAFTGAQQAKTGLLESANGGSVLLDEVGDLPLSTQAKLLHALEHREVLRVGGVKPRPIDARFIAATNLDLVKAIDTGRFRQDLYFRLNGMTITIPPLRERRTEIPELVVRFLNEASAQLGGPVAAITEAALDRLVHAEWLGNVRELRNVVLRAVLVARGRAIDVAHLPQHAPPGGAGQARTLGEDVRELERLRIVDALKRCCENQVEAAKVLGIARGTLRTRMKAHGLLPRRHK